MRIDPLHPDAMWQWVSFHWNMDEVGMRGKMLNCGDVELWEMRVGMKRGGLGLLSLGFRV